MLKQHHRHQPKQQQSLKEEAARVVVRDALCRGHGCVELRHDGSRPIFFCVRCGTRCYTDAALWDHLNGNVHARNLADAGTAAAGAPQDTALKNNKILPNRVVGDNSRALVEVKMKNCKQLTPLLPPQLVVVPDFPLKLIDQGQLLLKVRPCSGSRIVEACWFEKRALLQQPGEVDYAIVVFPYSEGLGRAGNWKNERTETNQEQMKKLMIGRGRKRAKQVERICFVCRQKMVAGKDVATLLNVSNKQMMCHSRNLRGAFHVYHTCCLINWISIFDAKLWMGHSLAFSRYFRKSLINSSELQSLEQQDSSGSNKKPIFCPECQGTGFRFHGGQLERPRYRLSQIFDWVLELVQARTIWVDNFGQEIAGLLFHASKGICNPRDFESSLVLPRGMLQLYSTDVDSHDSSKEDDRMEIDRNETGNMEIDI